MKKPSKFHLAILMSIIFSFSLFAQEEISVSKQNRLIFDQENEVVEISLETSKEYNYLSLNLALSLEKGRAKVELIDPKGKIKSSMTLETDNIGLKNTKTTSEVIANGNLKKTFRHPLIGKWKIRISPKEAITGRANLSYGQKYNPKIDVLELDQLNEDSVKSTVR